MSNAPAPLLVHVVEDDPAVLDSLCWLLESDGHRCTRSRSAEQLLEALGPAPADEAEPSCVVTDLALPGISGLEMFRELERRGHRLPTLVVTGRGSVAAAVDALTGGCAGFLQKPYDDGDLLARVRALRPGGPTAGPASHRVTLQDRVATLSPRELEVLERVAAGWSNREVAAGLGVSTKTVEAHRSRVMEKMRAGSLAELVRMAVRVGI